MKSWLEIVILFSCILFLVSTGSSWKISDLWTTYELDKSTRKIQRLKEDIREKDIDIAREKAPSVLWDKIETFNLEEETENDD